MRKTGYLTIARLDGDPDRLLETYLETSPVMDEVGRDHGLILHAGARTDEGLLVVNLWPGKSGSEAAAADQRRLQALRRTGLTPGRQRKEHHELQRYVVF